MITKRLVFTLLIGTLAFTGCSQTKHESTNSLDEPSEVLENTDVQDSGEEEFNFSYECLNTTEFWFGSGAGAWRTTLRIKNDGSFYGEYSDTDAGSISSEAPNGISEERFHLQVRNWVRIVESCESVLTELHYLSNC